MIDHPDGTSTDGHFHPRVRMVNARWQRRWMRFWMRRAGIGWYGRMATRLAALWAHPHKARDYLARMSKRGYISPETVIYHDAFYHGEHVFIDDRVVIFQRPQGEAITMGRQVYIYRDTIIETGYGGALSLGDGASIHPRCQLNAYMADIHIGNGVMLAPNCALYAYDHGISPGTPIREQAFTTRGPIHIGDDAWLGVGAIVLSGVTIGEGAVVGAGSVVSSDIPAGGIAVGNPARTVRYRADRTADAPLTQGAKPE